jgi:DedD protein
VDAPRTHYQISLTARQALGLFAALLVALALAFFFGLQAGLAGRAPAPRDGEAVAALGAPRVETPEAMPRVETAVPTAVFTGPSRTVLAPVPAGPTPAPEATIPATIQPFDDRSADEPAASETPPVAAAQPPSATERPAASSAGKYWVQVASLTSREEAGSLQTRLSRRGFHAQILSADGPHGKGRVYRIRVGPYGSEPEAQKVATRLARQEKLKGPWVVPEGK